MGKGKAVVERMLEPSPGLHGGVETMQLILLGVLSVLLVLDGEPLHEGGSHALQLDLTPVVVADSPSFTFTFFFFRSNLSTVVHFPKP
jgi:hypothetical protein